MEHGKKNDGDRQLEPKAGLKIEELSFEEALQRLENLVEKMEKEELPLEESLRCFQEGTELTRHCRKLLSEADSKVKVILEEGALADFEEAERKDVGDGDEE